MTKNESKQNLLSVSEHKLLNAFTDHAQTLLRSKAYQKACNAFSKALDMSPEDPTLLCGRSRCFINIGMYQLALLDATLAIDCNPQIAEGYYCQGLALRHLGCVADAVKALQEAVRLDPTSLEYKNALESLKSVATTETASPAPPTAAKRKSPRKPKLVSQLVKKKHYKLLGDDEDFIKLMTEEVEELSKNGDTPSTDVQLQSNGHAKPTSSTSPSELAEAVQPKRPLPDLTITGASPNTPLQGSPELSPIALSSPSPPPSPPAPPPARPISSARVTYPFASSLPPRRTPQPHPPRPATSFDMRGTAASTRHQDDDDDDDLSFVYSPVKPEMHKPKGPRRRAATATVRSSSVAATMPPLIPSAPPITPRPPVTPRAPAAQRNQGPAPQPPPRRTQSAFGMRPSAAELRLKLGGSQSSLGLVPLTSRPPSSTRSVTSARPRRGRPPLSARSVPVRTTKDSRPPTARSHKPQDFRQFLRDVIRPVLEEVNAKFASVDSRRRAEMAIKRRLVADSEKFDFQAGYDALMR